MQHLWFSTLEMMALTFAIGFFVASLIKLIAKLADTLNMYSTHRQELLRLKRMKKIRAHVAELLTEDVVEEYGIKRGAVLSSFKRGFDRNSDETEGFYHETSKGAEKHSILDYYYSDTKDLFLNEVQYAKNIEKEEQSKKSK